MVQPTTTEPTNAAPSSADPTQRALSFDDMFVLTTGGVDVFVYDMNEAALSPPYYIEVAGRRFAFTGLTYLEHGHGAVLPTWVRGEEMAGRLTLFVRRNERLLAYLHDPAAVEGDDEAEPDEAEEA